MHYKALKLVFKFIARTDDSYILFVEVWMTRSFLLRWYYYIEDHHEALPISHWNVHLVHVDEVSENLTLFLYIFWPIVSESILLL